jgi:hypothetical protein
MKKQTKPTLQLLCTILAIGLSAWEIAGVQAQQPKPSGAPTAKPAPPIAVTTYSFFQGMTWQPFPGTIPRAAFGSGNSASSLYPIVEVPTPGLATPGNLPRQNTTRRKVAEETPAPVRRRRRIKPE